MGNDDLFRKRKARQAKDLARKTATRAPYDRVLIVCEGSKTEPKYFRDLIDGFRLNTANVEIDKTKGSSPKTVVERAKNAFEKARKTGDPYDRVFCVFDKDQHGNAYTEALDRIRNMRPAHVYKAIPSVPCFEYWLLLHFVYTRQSYYGNPSKSPCERVIESLRRHFPDYHKAGDGVYARLYPHLDTAIANADNALSDAKDSNSDDPSTEMHLLITYLRHLSRS